MILDDRIHDMLDRLEADPDSDLSGDIAAEDSAVLHSAKIVARRLAMADRMLGLDGDEQIPLVPGYELHSLIGVGGMGEVWKAMQLSTRRWVALKLMARPGFGSQRARSRFEREVELASRLAHPNIARVYDSGLHQGGFFYAMELIDGVTLDQFARHKQLSSREVLDLIRKIALVVQNAHQMGVIHRDLKPSNILVSADGEAHVVDFGLAKEVIVEGATEVSIDGGVPGTPAYMSPEQAAGDASRIGVGSDVYSLGVIAYLLLLNRLPHDVAGSPMQIANRVATINPIRPRTVDAALDRDVEAILLKSLSREIDLRYATAEHFAEDIQRWLNGLPIEARRRTRLYVAGKFVRRNAGKVVAVAGVTAFVLTTAIFAFVKIRAERDRATDAADTTREVNEFFNHMLTAGNPELGNGVTPTLQEIVDVAAANLDGRFDDRPLVESGIRLTIGRTYLGLSQADRAAPHLKRAWELRHRLLDDNDTETLDAKLALVSMSIATSHFAEAESNASSALKMSEASLGRLHPRTLDAMELLVQSLFYQARLGEARDVGSDLARRYAEAYGKDDPRAVDVRASLDSFLTTSQPNNIQAAESTLRHELSRLQREVGPRSPRVLGAMSQLAANLVQQNRLEEADALLTECVQLRRQVFGNEHRYTAFAVHGLAYVKDRRGLPAEAEQLYRESLAINLKLLGDAHIETMNDQTALLLLLSRQRRDDEAKSIVETMDAIADRKLGETTTPDVAWLIGYTDTLRVAGLRDHAKAIVSRALTVATGAYGPADPKTALITAALARLSAATTSPSTNRAPN